MGNENKDRADRVKRLKKIIVISILILIILPTLLCFILFIKMNKMQNQIEHLLQVKQDKLEQQIDNEFIASSSSSGAQMDLDILSENKVDEVNSSETELKSNTRNVYLTFDDGPSAFTDTILDILEQYDVKATFFVVGKEDPKYKPIYKRIVDDGHTIAMHSYSHDYWDIYSSVSAYSTDLKKLQNYIYLVTGVIPMKVRFPGGSSNQVSQVDMQSLISYLQDNGMQYYDWNISSGDASSSFLSAQTIVDNVTKDLEKYQNATVLFHDANDKPTTVEALPIIIEKILAIENTAILPITDATKPVQHVKNENDETISTKE